MNMSVIPVAIKRIWEDASLTAKLVGGSIAAGTLVIIVVVRRFRNAPRKQYPPDTVVFHHIGHCFNVPSLPPFAVKLETYFRMAKIPYMAVESYQRSSKGKWPWIEYNNEEIADSEFCIEFLNEKKGVNLNSHLTPVEKGIGRAFQKMLEENTYWVIPLDRFVFDKTRGVAAFFNIPKFCVKLLEIETLRRSYAHGIGRHSEQQIYHIMRKDFEALSNFIGEKKFLFGDRACQYDCAVFGQLSQCRWETFGGQLTNIIEEFPVLCQYCENMKNEFWPDWDDCTIEGRKKKLSQQQK